MCRGTYAVRVEIMEVDSPFKNCPQKRNVFRCFRGVFGYFFYEGQVPKPSLFEPKSVIVDQNQNRKEPVNLKNSGTVTVTVTLISKN